MQVDHTRNAVVFSEIPASLSRPAGVHACIARMDSGALLADQSTRCTNIRAIRAYSCGGVASVESLLPSHACLALHARTYGMRPRLPDHAPASACGPN